MTPLVSTEAASSAISLPSYTVVVPAAWERRKSSELEKKKEGERRTGQAKEREGRTEHEAEHRVEELKIAEKREAE